jgi:hypothetical protein
VEASRLCRMPHNRRMQPTVSGVTGVCKGGGFRFASPATPRATLTLAGDTRSLDGALEEEQGAKIVVTRSDGPTVGWMLAGGFDFGWGRLEYDSEGQLAAFGHGCG